MAKKVPFQIKNLAKYFFTEHFYYLERLGESSSVDQNNNTLRHFSEEEETEKDNPSNAESFNQLGIPSNHRFEVYSTQRSENNYSEEMDPHPYNVYDKFSTSNIKRKQDDKLEMTAVKINDSEPTGTFSLGRMIAEGIYVFTQEEVDNNYQKILEEYEKNGESDILIYSDVLVDEVSNEDFGCEHDLSSHLTPADDCVFANREVEMNYREILNQYEKNEEDISMRTGVLNDQVLSKDFDPRLQDFNNFSAVKNSGNFCYIHKLIYYFKLNQLKTVKILLYIR